MAKVIGPLHSTEARGVFGAGIFNTWRGIRTVKRMTSPAQPRTKRALQIRAYTIQLVRHWQTLAASVHAEWNHYADEHPLLDWTGVAKRITGCNWFVGLNLRLLDLGMVLEPEPPLVAPPLPLAAYDVLGGTRLISASWTPTAGTNLSVQVMMYGPHSPGKQGKIERATLAGYVEGETPPFSVTGVLPGFYTVWSRVVSEDDGQVSTWVVDSATATAA